VADVDQLIADIAAQLGDRKPAILAIDTLNRSLAGSESSDEDMGNYIKATDKLRERFGCAVVIIHHCGYDERHPRGHTSLLGAADAQMAVKKDGSGLITTEVEYLKDGPEGETTASRLKVVDHLDRDEDDEPISSCVIEPNDSTTPPDPAKRKPLSAQRRRALELLGEAVGKTGEIPPVCEHIPANTLSVREDLWREYYYTGQIAGSDKQEAKRQAFKRAVAALLAEGYIGKWGDWVWIVL
jgi:hypothetical protein